MAAARIRIVCIDDDKHILDINKKVLEMLQGYEVICFTNGREGIEGVKKHKPDLVLLDMNMPVIDGIDVIKELKSTPATRPIPVIFMTAQKNAGDMKKYMDLGALSVITKPVDIESFPMQMEMLSKIISKK